MFNRIKNKYIRRILKIVSWVIGFFVSTCILFCILFHIHPQILFSAINTIEQVEGYYRKIFDPCYVLVDSVEFNPKKDYLITKDRVCVRYNKYGSWSKLKTLSTYPETFEVLSGYYAKDRNNVYYDGEKIRGADPETFELLSSYYGKDKNNVYHYNKKIRGADPETFEFFSDGYEKDKNNIYLSGKKISGADPETFENIGLMYAKDKNNIYCGCKKLQGTDINTFKVVDNPGFGLDAEDKNNTYYRCERYTNEIRFKDVIKIFFK